MKSVTVVDDDRDELSLTAFLRYSHQRLPPFRLKEWIQDGRLLKVWPGGYPSDKFDIFLVAPRQLIVRLAMVVILAENVLQIAHQDSEEMQ